LADSWSFLANQKARNAIVGAENLLMVYISGKKDEYEEVHSNVNHIFQKASYPSLQFVSPGAGGLSSLATCVQTPSYSSHCLVLAEQATIIGIPNKPGRFF